MQISLRSQMTAGMVTGVVAVVGAGAIAMTPVVVPSTTAMSVPMTTVADVQLAALSFSDVLNFLGTLGLGGALPDITSITNLLPANVVTAAVTEFVSEITPVVTGAAGEVLGALGTAVTGLIVGSDSVLARIIGAVGNLPGVVTTAVQSLSSGDFAGAFQAVSTGLLAPFTAIGQAIATAVSTFQAFVTAKLGTVAAALPTILINSIQSALGGNFGSLLTSVQSLVTNWISGVIPGAAAVAPAAAAARVGVAASPVAAAAVAPRAKRAAAASAAAAGARSRVESAKPEASKPAAGPRAAAARHAVRSAAA